MNFLPLDDFFDAVEKSWPFDINEYPIAGGMTRDQWRLFAMKHVVTHLGKSHGVLSGLVEKMDHGEKLDYKEAETAIRKQFVNLARLAKLCDVKPEDLDRGVKEWLREAKGITFD